MHLMAALGVFALVVALLATVGGVDSGLLHLAPAMVLFLPLLGGRYVGEERLHALAAALKPLVRRPARVLSSRLPRAPRTVAVRGGLLVATGRGLRGPPALV